MCYSILTRMHEPAMMLMAMILIQHPDMMPPMKISQSIPSVTQYILVLSFRPVYPNPGPRGTRSRIFKFSPYVKPHD